MTDTKGHEKDEVCHQQPIFIITRKRGKTTITKQDIDDATCLCIHGIIIA